MTTLCMALVPSTSAGAEVAFETFDVENAGKMTRVWIPNVVQTEDQMLNRAASHFLGREVEVTKQEQTYGIFRVEVNEVSVGG